MTALRCECEEISRATYGPEYYLPEERKAMNHEPGLCPGDHELHLYERDGKRLTLCSCCSTTHDLRIDVPALLGGSR